MSPEFGQPLSHYRLLEKIGEGGMGVVWKAKDTVLGRLVAIKVLAADHAVDDRRRRMFLAEAKLASAVENAHVARIYELGRDGDTDFIVMEFVEGRPLHQALVGSRQPAERIADIGAQIARGLAQAHRQGLLHRDIKPANVLLTPDGEVKIVDFGIATLTEPAAGDVDSSGLTRTSALDIEPPPDASPRPAPAMGTLPYMSPEAVRREPLEAQSDVFSVGVLLYELATGRRPFVGNTEREIAEQILAADPIAPSRLVPGLVPELNRIILKAIAARPADRYQTMDDLAVDLRTLGRDLELGGTSPTLQLDRTELPDGGRRRRWRSAPVLALAALLVVGGGWLLSRRLGGAAVDSGTLLVLPFRVADPEAADDYLGLAVSEALTVNLARAPELRVLPVPDVEPTAGGFPGLVREARRRGAGRLLQGRIVRRDETLSASVSLLDTGDERVLWGMQADASERDLPGLVARLTDELAAELGVAFPREYDYIGDLTGGPAMTASAETARAIAAIRRGEIAAALEATERLVELFPREAAAHALRSQALLLWWDANPSADNRQRLQESMAVAERLDPQGPYVEFWRAYMSDRDGRPEASLQSYATLLRRDDLTPAARGWILRWRSQVRDRIGDADLALADLRESLRLDPTNAWTLSLLSTTLSGLDRADEAIVYARQSVALNPWYWRNQLILGLALERAGRAPEAAEAYRRACELGEAQVACSLHGLILERSGRHEAGGVAIEHAATLVDGPEGQYNIACYRALTGETGEAVAALRRAVELGMAREGFADDPDLASLRDDEGFRRLLAEE
jgi:tetratricopeptide (TPR) repeat protein/predicted Ser/Thr protein kinase